MSACRSCAATVRWVVTEADKRMPLDPDPVEDGNIVALAGDTVRVLAKDELAARKAQPGGPGLLYKSHFASCENAAAHRKSR